MNATNQVFLDGVRADNSQTSQQDDSERHIESHPFPPVLTPDANIMMMGTFPPTEDKWGMPFHYPNFYNDMWRIYGRIFFNDDDHFRDGEQKAFDPERIKAFLRAHAIASCPTVQKAIREQGNASDKHLTIVEPVDLKGVLAQLPNLHTIFTTGGKATEILMTLLSEEQGKPIPKSKWPKTNQCIDYPYNGRQLTLYRLPSTSRAYPLSLAKKTEAYRQFFQSVGKV